jgi:hypothetical protein
MYCMNYDGNDIIYFINKLYKFYKIKMIIL